MVMQAGGIAVDVVFGIGEMKILPVLFCGIALIVFYPAFCWTDYRVRS